ncbi:MAG: hypothetical protein KGM24_09570 [Elusimicrobia bacterium]|nr:hypothetical protein [Elusimicrobiota bacterium]
MKYLVAAGFLATMCLAGCTYNRQMVITSAAHSSNDKVVGIVKGNSEKNYYLFGLFQSGDDSLGTAFADAVYKSSTPAQGLIDVFAEKYCTLYFPPFYWTCGTSLTGAALQYGELGNRRLIREQDIPKASPETGTTTGGCPLGTAFEYGSCYPVKPTFGKNSH